MLFCLFLRVDLNFFSMSIEHVLKLCAEYNGVKEIGRNQGFDNEEFEAVLVAAGWRKGEPWCAFAVRGLFQVSGLAYKYISGSAWRTALNGSLRGYVWTNQPKRGALIVWRRFVDGKPLAAGHIGIVFQVLGSSVFTFEGNADTDDLDKIQEFGKHKHVVTSAKWRVKNGLRLMGYLYPPELV
jgi:hypothetical protein